MRETERLQLESQLVGEIYDAALESARWPRVLQHIAEAADFSRVNLILLDHLNPAFNLLLGHGTTQAEYDRYVEGGFADLDMALSLKWPNFRDPGTLIPSYEAFGSHENWMRTAGRLYDEFYQFIDSEYHLGGSLEVGEFRWSILSMHRGKASPLFDQGCIEFSNRMAQHIRRALQIHRQLTFVRQQNVRLHGLLEKISVGVLLLNGYGQVRFATPKADRLMSSVRAIQVGLNGSLRAVNKDENCNGQVKQDRFLGSVS